MGNDMYNDEQLAAAADLEAARDRARLASRLVVAEREVAAAHGLLTAFGVPEQIPPFKTALAPPEWEHWQGWHADEYVDVCPICITRARMPEEKEKEVECD